jgi:hypothetical protein
MLLYCDIPEPFLLTEILYASVWDMETRPPCASDTLVGINIYIEKKQCDRYVIKSEKCYECGNAQMQIILTKENTKFTAEDTQDT